MAILIIGSDGLKHPSVQKVIQIAKEIVDENKPLTTERLYNTAKKRVNLSRRGLLSIINFLFNKKVLLEGSRYTKKSILLNPYRKKIYNFVQNNLGAHFSLIKREALSGEGTEGSPGQLIWHLEKLLKFKYIKKLRVGKYALFLPVDIDDKVGRICFILRDELNTKIINIFIEHRLLKKAEIHKFLEKSRELVYYRLNSLIEYEILTLSEQNPDELILNPLQKELIKKILNKTFDH